MKILISSMAGADRTDSRHFRNVLTRLGHEVYWVTSPRLQAHNNPGDFPEPGLLVGTSLEELLAHIGVTPDLFLYLEPGGLIPEGMERAPFPTACVLCDMHNNLGVRLNIASFFDYVVSYQRNYINAFSQHPVSHVSWFPIALDKESFFPLVPVDGHREYDLAFIGQMNTPERKAIVSALAERYRMNAIRNYLQSEIPDIYSQAKMVLNLPRADDLNYRVFEAMSAGAMLLTKRSDNGMDDLFQEGRHFAAFSSLDEACDKIDYYLSHEIERNMIAQAGLREFQANHSLDQRLSTILNWLRQDTNYAAPIRRMNPTERDKTYTYLYETLYLLDPILRRVGTAVQEKRSWLHMAPSIARMTLRYLSGRLPIH